MSEHSAEGLLRRAYAAFNDRDIETAVALMAEDVTWPDLATGGFVHGRNAVREHWRQQFEAADPLIELLGIESGPDGEVQAAVRQIVRSNDGETVSDERLTHVYVIRDGLIRSMEPAR
jgi:ketosteroid isomerase-like protein